MISSRFHKLQLLWDYFIHAKPQSSEKSSWLDLFLAEFLIQIHNGVNVNEIFHFYSSNGGIDGSISTLIACELLSDINELCATRNEVDQLVELHKYLVEGRGWRSLAVLHLLGVQGLSCGRKLTALLIALYPVSYHASLERHNSSNIISTTTTTTAATNTTTTTNQQLNSPPHNPYVKLNLSSYVVDVVDIICQIKKQNRRKLRNSTTALDKVNTDGLRKKRKKSSVIISNGTRLTRAIKQNRLNKEIMESDNNVSTESEGVIEETNQIRPPILKIRLNPMDFDYFTSVIRSSDEEKDIKVNASRVHQQSIPSSTHQKPADFITEHIENVFHSNVDNFEISLLILKLLQSMKDYNSSVDQTFAVKVVKFSLDTLWSLQFNTDTLNLSTSQCIKLKTMTARLIFIALEQIICNGDASIVAAVIHNGLIPIMLRLLEDIISPKSLTILTTEDGCLCQEYIFTLVYSIISFLYYLLYQRKAPHKIQDFLELFQLFINSQDGKLLQKVIALIVELSSNDVARSMTWIKKIIDVVGVLINGIKCIALEDMDKLKTNKSSEIYHHNNNNLFGLEYSQSLLLGDHVADQICCVSLLFKILLNLMEQSVKLQSEIQMRLIKIMTHSGICCCFPPQFLLTNVIDFIKNNENNKKIYTGCITLLERCLFQEFGILSCDFSAVDCTTCTNTNYSWDFLEVYRSLLSPDNSHLCYIIMAHLLRVTPNMNLQLKQEMLFRVFYPTLIRMKSIYNKEIVCRSNIEFIIQSCISIISYLIVNNQIYEKFIDIHGLQEILQLFSNFTFTRAVCNLLQVSVIMEIWKIIKIDQSDEIEQSDITQGSMQIQIFFEIIHQETNKLYLSLKNLENEFERTELLKKTDDYTINSNDVLLKVLDNKTLHKKNHKDIIYDEILGNNLFLTSTVWRAAAGVFFQCPKFRTEMSRNSITNKAMDLLKILTVLIVEDRILDKNKQAYKLIDALITCCLTWPISDCDVITVLRNTLINSGIQLRRGITVLVEALLRVAMLKPCQDQIALQPNRPRVPTMISETSSPDFCEDDSSTGEYITADDGYEADIENQARSSKDTFSKNINSITPIPEIRGYGNANPILCSLAIDLLIHFSEQSLNKERCAVVTQGLRKIAITCRDSMSTCASLAGGGVITKLLNGFETILINGDTQYKDLHYAILEVFTLLAMQSISSEELLFYFSLFKADSPPLLALLQPLYRLITNLQPQPNYILTFPILSESKIQQNVNDRRDNNKNVEKTINIVNNFKKKHLTSGICSPWSVHALYLPIGSDLSWSVWLNGCSISMWVRVERGCLFTANRGTPQQSPGNLFNTESDSFSEWGILSDNWSREVCAGSLSPPSPTTIIHLISIGFESLVLESWLDLNCDKMILRLTRPDDKTNRTISEASINGILSSGRWHHLAFNIKDTILNRQSAVVNITIWVDGWRQTVVNLPFDGLLMRKPGNTCVMVGQSGPSSNGAWYLGNLMLFRCPVFTKVRALYLTSLGPNYTNLAECILNPIRSNFTSLIACNALDGVRQVKLENGKFDTHRRKSYGGTYHRQTVEIKVMNSDINWESLMDNSNSHLGELQDNILLCYEAKCPTIVNLYPQAITNPTAVVRNILPSQGGFRVISAPEHRISQQPPLSVQVMTSNCRLERQQYRGFISSASLIGGTSIFLYLFARIVELNSTEEEHARALSIVINLIRNDSELMTQYNLEGGHALIMRILESPRCHAGKQVLKAIFDCACDASIIVHDVANSNYTILQNCEAIIIDPELIKESLSAWKTWVKFDTFNLLLQALFTLLRDQHSQREFNAVQLNRVEVVETILSICKDHFMYDDFGTLWDEITANTIVELIRSLMGAPPEFSHLIAIMDYLILVHQASDTYITHSRHNMYFLLPSLAEVEEGHKYKINLMNKLSSISVSRGTSSSSDESVEACEIIKSSKALINKQLQKDRAIKKREKRYINNNSNNINNSNSNSVNGNNNDNNDTLDNSAGEDSGIAASEGSNSKIKNDKYSLSPDEKRACQGFVTEGFLLLLRDALRVLPDCQVEPVVKHVIRAELLLVLANNPDTRVRAAIIKVLQVYIQRASSEEINKFIKHKYFYHLSNQLTIYPGSESLASVLEGLASRDSTLASIPPLLAILTKTPATGLVNSTRQIIAFITEIINKNTNSLRILFEHGLFESLAQSLAVGAHKNNTSLFNDIYIIFVTIVIKLLELSGNNQIPMILDLHSILSYIEFNERTKCGSNANCVSVIRTAQVVLFDSELDALMPKVALKSGFKLRSTASYFASTSYLTNTLTTSSEHSDHESHSSSYNSLYGYKEPAKGEINQRFRIILFKAIEFITSFDYIPMNNELELTKKLFVILLYGLSCDFDKKNNWSGSWSSRQTFRKNTAKIILWMLSPHQCHNTKIFIIRSLMEESKGREILMSLIESDNNIEKKFTLFLWDLFMKKSEMPSADARLCMEFKEALIVWQVMKEIDNPIPELWEQELTLINREFIRDSEIFVKNNLSVIQRIENKFNILAKQLSDSAMIITRSVIEEQSRERKALLEKLKYTRAKQAQIMARWRDIIRRLTHERGPWYFPKCYPHNWELDPTEGPARVRTRMQRCHLNINKKFFMSEYQDTIVNENSIDNPLSYLFTTMKQDVNASALIERLHTTESIHKMSQAKIVTPQAELPGEALIGETCLYFIPDNPEISLYTQDISLGGLDFAMAGGMAWKLQDIRELHKRRYQLQERAIEFFLTTGRTYLLAFNSSKDRDEFVSKLLQCNLPHRIPGDDLNEALVAWRNGSLTNWEYIMCLNKLAGRSYNDLMQYPVFPFVLADYTSDKIDLNNHKIYRNFKRPMAVQDKKNEQHYINMYNYLKQDIAEGVNRVALNKEPYHYGSHYSNSGTVLHFLVRLPPFTSMFLNYQDDNFDIPDRTFHSLATTWRLTSCDSTTDVKELIPEFFYLSEFLLNSGGFNFGLRQNGSRVGDVELPSWCKGDARLFILVNRAALEATYVRENLPYWIDLVFGFRQIGKPAVEAINVFHPATYYGFNVDQIDDPLERKAWETMVRTYGQTPAQLFTMAHLLPVLSANINAVAYNNIPPVIENVTGIEWGNYVGAPGNEPVFCWKDKHRVPMASLIPLITGDVFGLPIHTALLIGCNNEKGINTMLNSTTVLGAALVSWNDTNNDGIVRLKAKKEQPPKPLIKSSGLDPITAVGSAPNCGQLWLGHHSGKIIVYSYNIMSTGKIDFKLTPASVLLAHRSDITVIVLSKNFSIVVSGDHKGIIVIWDLNSLLYVKSISCESIYLIHSIAVSDTLGDIAVICQIAATTELLNNENNTDHQSQLKVFTINAKSIGSILSRRKITSVCYSNAPEGISVNVIATGLDNGVIRLWSSWDLRLIREIVNGGKDCGSIISITWSHDQHHLYAATDTSLVLIWEGRKRLSNNTPKFVNLSTL